MNNSSTCDILDGDNQEKCNIAVEYARQNKKIFISHFADIEKYPKENNPISIFMAGSPGAGKTEFSKRLISELKSGGIIERDPVRIDPDDIRGFLPGYTGTNSYIFQAASAIGVEKLYDHVLDKRQSAIIDGTFSSEKSIQNIERSVKRNRPIEIFYIYQDPKLAWEFTKKRESLEGRNIPKEAFIEAFFTSKENVNNVKLRFGDKVRLNLVKKDFVSGFEELRLNIDKVDHYLEIPYTRDDLNELIS
jgi:predicted ABC-type ATPase